MKADPDSRASIEFEVAARSARARVLVAEDNTAFRRLVVQTLKNDGFDVVEAKNGAELLERIAEAGRGRVGECTAFDLIVSDVRMPVASGIEVLSKLRGEGRSTPIILMTAFGDRELHEEARRLGADAVFDKPFDLVDLRTMALFLSGRA